MQFNIIYYNYDNMIMVVWNLNNYIVSCNLVV
jgi:hypothetical protein